MNLNPFINLISTILSLYSFILLAWMVLGWLVRFNIINQYQFIVKRLMDFCDKLFEPVLYQIRKVAPPIAGIDLSPIVLILLINFTKEFLFTYLYTF